MDTQRRVFPHKALYMIVTVVTVLTPSWTRTMAVKVITKTLNIQSPRTEPPRVAFDEIFKDESLSEWNLLQSNSGAQNLSEENTGFARRISSDFFRAKKVTLPTMIFSRVEVQNAVQAAIDNEAWIKQFPPTEQKRLVAVQEKYGTLDQDWTEPTFRQLAEKKIQDINQQEQAELERSAPAKVLIEATLPNGSKVSPQSVQKATIQVKKEDDADQTPSYYTVSGEIEYSGMSGLPAGPRWQIRVARYEDDIKKEEALIDHRNIYQIQVPRLTGSIFAQLMDRQTGDVLGEGSYRLSAYAKDQIHGKAKIVIHKRNDQVSVAMRSFYQNPSELTSKMRMADVRVNKNVPARILFSSINLEGKTDSDGIYRFDQIMKGSWGLLRTEARDFHSALFLVKSGEEKTLPLFPEKMIQSMKQIIADQALSSQVAETGSIVWGRVSQSGKPVAGVQVEAEFYEQYVPVYFNNLLIPDSSLKATSENGFFAFVHLPSGFHSLVSRRGSAYFSHANVVVDDNAISIAEMENSLQTEKVEVKVFDAFSGAPQDGDLELQGLGEQIHVQGFAQLDLQPISRLSFLRVYPKSSNFLESFQVYDDSGEFIHIPLISKGWLSNIIDARRINVVPDTGTIVGFASFSDFEVYLGHEEKYSSENIIYFTAQGQVSESGVKGGGFILQNVPQGVQSVVLVAKNSGQIQSQVVPVDSSILTTLKFK